MLGVKDLCSSAPTGVKVASELLYEGAARTIQGWSATVDSEADTAGADLKR
jgi:hypothetical protein